MQEKIKTMKNIHVLPTDNSSRLSIKDGVLILHRQQWRNGTQNIYITSDEEIKEGDWFVHTSYGQASIQKAIEVSNHILDNQGMISNKENNSKIILTTDQDLTKDGVQAIDDEFLEWFVKNPSCDEIKFEKVSVMNGRFRLCYKIIIPKEEPKTKCYCGHTTYCDCGPLEEPKQETLEEAARNYAIKKRERKHLSNREFDLCQKDFIVGAKWQQERMYSEEEVISFLQQYRYDLSSGKTSNIGDTTKLWFEQFKKK